MKNSKIFLFSVAIAIAFSACTKDDSALEQASTLDQDLRSQLIKQAPSEGLEHFILPNENDLSALPQDPKNPLSSAKVALGKLLYHETGLAVNAQFSGTMNTFSCASCHHAAAGFQAGMKQGLSDGGMGFGAFGEGRIKDPNCPIDSIDVQPIRSPSILNTGYQEAMLWNGQFGATGINAGTEIGWTPGTPKEVNNLGYEGLEIQAIAGQAVHRVSANEPLFESTEYRQMFLNAFGQANNKELYSTENIGLAIAAYERTVVATEAPFQRWLRGEYSAMNDQQKQGAKLFFGKANCSTCHSGPGLNNMEFHALGMNDFNEAEVFKIVDEATKKGRGGFTQNPDDDYKFKVPQLYNLTQSPFYGHGGSFTSVEDVVRYKVAGIPENPIVPSNKISPLFKPLNLDENEIKALTAFIEKGLHDPNLERYVPESLPSGQCFPFNDAQSKLDLGCE